MNIGKISNVSFQKAYLVTSEPEIEEMFSIPENCSWKYDKDAPVRFCHVKDDDNYNGSKWLLLTGEEKDEFVKAQKLVNIEAEMIAQKALNTDGPINWEKVFGSLGEEVKIQLEELRTNFFNTTIKPLCKKAERISIEDDEEKDLKKLGEKVPEAFEPYGQYDYLMPGPEKDKLFIKIEEYNNIISDYCKCNPWKNEEYYEKLNKLFEERNNQIKPLLENVPRKEHY